MQRRDRDYIGQRMLRMELPQEENMKTSEKIHGCSEGGDAEGGCERGRCQG